MLKSNKELKYMTNDEAGELVKVEFSNHIILCECVEPVPGTYTSLVVRDSDPDVEIIEKLNRSWSRRMRINHAKGTLYKAHINQIRK